MNIFQAVDQSNEVLNKQTRFYIRLLAVVSIVGMAIGLVSNVLLDAQAGSFNIANIINVILSLLALSIVVVLSSTAYLRLAAVLLVLGLLGGVLSDERTFLITGALALISVSVLGNTTAFTLVNLIVIGKGALGVLVTIILSNFQLSPAVNIQVVELVVLVLITIAVRYFTTNAELSATIARRNADLLRTVAELGRVTAGLLNPTDLLVQSADFIRDRFAYYHVQVFLANETADEAVLVASTGDIGQQLLEQQYRVSTNSRTAVGRMLQAGEPMLTRDTDQGTIFESLPLLTNTRSQFVLPIMDGSRIMAALDVHSLRRDAFQANDIQALQIMSNQLATAIRNARLFEEQQRSLNENKRLFLESENKVREVQRLNQQLTKAAWEGYLAERRELGGVTLRENMFLPDENWTESMILASQRRQPVSRMEGDQQIIAVPIVLRGEVLGAIEIEPSEPIREADTVEMMRSVAERLATTLENTRLLEQTQADTAQKQRINEIVAQYQTVTTIDDLLRLTLAELSASLGAERGSIRLGGIESAQEVERTNGHA